jgi:hypothetical protein
MKKIKKMIVLLLLSTGICHTAISQGNNTAIKQQPAPSAEIYEASKKITALMKGVSLEPRSSATTDDKKLLKQFESIRSLATQIENGKGRSRSDLGQQLQLACQEANNIAKLKLTGRISLFPGDCYDNCDDQVGSGAAWNEFFCVFKCFKAATVNFD